ncbi:MAG: hypothetical protein FJX52_07660 [Alphaproteobacteria bacterium]|nr:hypothetical protein [Alphaproteobacteria bacterium]
MTGIVGLPMYDPPELRAAVEGWWAGLVRWLHHEGIDDAPARLTRDFPLDRLWSDPRLVLAQMCGYLLATVLADRLTYITTPCYRAPGCDGPHYRSNIIVPAPCSAHALAELRDQRVVVNSFESQSGHHALRHAVAPLARGGRFFASVAISGSHANSLDWVASGRADVAAIDCFAFALFARLRPAIVDKVRIFATTTRAPGMPYVTAVSVAPARVARMRKALAQAAADPSLAEIRRALLIEGFATLDVTDYQALPRLARESSELGYPLVA